MGIDRMVDLVPGKRQLTPEAKRHVITVLKQLEDELDAIGMADPVRATTPSRRPPLRDAPLVVRAARQWPWYVLPVGVAGVVWVSDLALHWNHTGNRYAVLAIAIAAAAGATALVSTCIRIALRFSAKFNVSHIPEPPREISPPPRPGRLLRDPLQQRPGLTAGNDTRKLR
jgi:hypothetical protein